jgi:nitrogenase-associated protein
VAKIIFYGKTGCKGNARQKRLLRLAGHELEVKDILTYEWSKEELEKFVGDKKFPDCFNFSAVEIKNGAINPQNYCFESSLDKRYDKMIEKMIHSPILIKRPLMIISGSDLDDPVYLQGFDKEKIKELIGLNNQDDSDEFEDLYRRDLNRCQNPGDTCD